MLFPARQQSYFYYNDTKVANFAVTVLMSERKRGVVLVLRGWGDTQCLGWVMPSDQAILTAGFFILYQNMAMSPIPLGYSQSNFGTS